MYNVHTPSGGWKNEGPLVSNCHTMYHGPPPPRQESRWGATRGTVITVKASGGMDTGNITERLLARSRAAHRHACATMQGAEGPCEAEHAPACHACRKALVRALARPCVTHRRLPLAPALCACSLQAPSRLCARARRHAGTPTTAATCRRRSRRVSLAPASGSTARALRAGARSRAKAAMATGANAAAPTAWTAERAWEAEAEE